MVADPRSISLSFRVTPSELAQLVDLAGGRRNLSEYLRARIFGRPYQRPVSIPQLNGEAWIALAPVLSNLNQLTRHANQTGELDRGLVDLLSRIEADVSGLRADLITGRDDDDR